MIQNDVNTQKCSGDSSATLNTCNDTLGAIGTSMFSQENTAANKNIVLDFFGKII